MDDLLYKAGYHSGSVSLCINQTTLKKVCIFSDGSGMKEQRIRKKAEFTQETVSFNDFLRS